MDSLLSLSDDRSSLSSYADRILAFILFLECEKEGAVFASIRSRLSSWFMDIVLDPSGSIF